ncbi:DUF5110 domain-containing protein [Scytonema sp. NUACC26]|uniref:DUF5110 domain-containing protein n=1 Tax=Scytonema sp. NUACC26 TaxID=3140176 RepID=UPI0034DBEB14
MEEKKQLTLHIYPPIEGNSENLLYSDAGDGYGDSRLHKFAITRFENNLEIVWTTEGKYPFPYRSISLHIHGIQPQQVWIDDKEVTCTGQIIELVDSEELIVNNRFCKIHIQD